MTLADDEQDQIEKYEILKNEGLMFAPKPKKRKISMFWNWLRWQCLAVKDEDEFTIQLMKLLRKNDPNNYH